MFLPSISPLEMMLRGIIVYISLFTLLRLILRREAASVSVPDLLMIVLIADAAQNAMAGEYKSITDGIVLVATIIVCNYIIDRLAFHFPFIGRLVHPPPLLLIRDGILLHRNMRKEFITREELMSQLRQQGVENIADVKSARIEGDGSISVITAGSQRKME